MEDLSADSQFVGESPFRVLPVGAFAFQRSLGPPEFLLRFQDSIAKRVVLPFPCPARDFDVGLVRRLGADPFVPGNKESEVSEKPAAIFHSVYCEEEGMQRTPDSPDLLLVPLDIQTSILCECPFYLFRSVEFQI